MARIDRVFVSTDWETTFPLARIKALNRLPSDHNPLLIDPGCNMSYGKERFRFEKWWLEKASFKDVVIKAWSLSCNENTNLDRCQFRIRTFRR
jgi:hypothetical protein